MNVILLVCVLTIACDSYGQEIKRVLSEEMDEGNSEVEKIEERSLQEKEPFKEDYDLWRLNNNDTLAVQLNHFGVQDGTKLGIIVVPDLAEEDVDLLYQPQNIFEIKANGTSDELIIANANNIFTDDTTFTTIASLEEEANTRTLVNFESKSEERYDGSLDSELKETTTELPTTVDPDGNPTHQVNKTLEVSDTSVTKKTCSSRKVFPRLDLEMIKRFSKEDQDNKVKRFSAHESSLKKLESRTFNSWNLRDGEEEKHRSVVKITKEVPYPVPYPVEKKLPVPVKVEVARPIAIEVPKPYPVTFEKKVFVPVREYIHMPYPVFKKLPYFIPIAVEKPIPIHIPRPYPVYIEKKVPYSVEKQVAIPINIAIDRPTPVHIPIVRNIYYPVEKKVRYPVAVSVEKPVAVPVEKPYPIYIEKKDPVPVEEHFSYPIHVNDNQFEGSISKNNNFQKENAAVAALPNHKTEYIENHGSPELGVSDSEFAPLNLPMKSYDRTLFQNKNDNKPEESKEEEILQERMTTQQPLKKGTREEQSAIKTNNDFGKKTRNM